MKKIIINLSFLFLAVIVALLLLEGITRIFSLSPLWEGVKKAYYKDNMARFNIQDKTLGWRTKPNLDLVLQKWQGEFNTRIQTNSKGSRCDEIPYQKTNDKDRILFLGDSFGWGFGVSNSELFSHILQTRYGETLEVINLSVSGYDLAQEYTIYKTEGVKYNPNTVILLLYIGNDIYRRLTDEDLNNIKKPYAILKKDELYWPSDYSLLTKSEFEQWGERKGFLDKIRVFIQTHSALSNLLFERLSNFPKLIPLLRKLGGIHVAQHTLYKITEDDIYVTMKILKRFKAEAKNNDSEFAVVIIPDTYHVTTTIETNNIDYSEETYRPIYWLTKQLESAKIAHINLLEEFTSAKWKDKKLYYTIDRHLNQEGHKALEQIIEDFLFKQ